MQDVFRVLPQATYPPDHGVVEDTLGGELRARGPERHDAF